MGNITLTNAEVLAALAALTTLQGAKASGKFKLKLARTTAVIRADVERINITLQDLQKGYIELDAAGAPVPAVVDGKPVPNTVVWKDRAACELAIKELLDATCEFAITSFTPEEIEPLDVGEGSLEGLLPLLAK